MARALRVTVAGGWYHVTARGVERRVIFEDDQDRQRMLELLEETTGRFGLRVHAFVLMANHYHLLLETPEGNLSRAMQWLNVSYSVWFNRRHARAGHLFQGRFRAEIVEPQEVAVAVTRYIHLNPVRTRAQGLGKRERKLEARGLRPPTSSAEARRRVRVLRGYRWSSYPDYIRTRAVHEWVVTDATLATTGGPKAGRRDWYRRNVEQALRSGLTERPWERLEAGLVLGGAAFVRKVRVLARGDPREQKALRRLNRPGGISFGQIVAAVEKVKGDTWEAFRDRHGDWGRDAVLYLARERGRLTLHELAERAGLPHYMSVAVAVSRFRRRLARDRRIAALVRQASTQLIKV